MGIPHPQKAVTALFTSKAASLNEAVIVLWHTNALLRDPLVWDPYCINITGISYSIIRLYNVYNNVIRSPAFFRDLFFTIIYVCPNPEKKQLNRIQPRGSFIIHLGGNSFCHYVLLNDVQRVFESYPAHICKYIYERGTKIR